MFFLKNERLPNLSPESIYIKSFQAFFPHILLTIFWKALSARSTGDSHLMRTDHSHPNVEGRKVWYL